METCSQQLKPSNPAEKPHVYIVLGKGGVGMSTTAIALSLKLSKEGKTLLVSFGSLESTVICLLSIYAYPS